MGPWDKFIFTPNLSLTHWLHRSFKKAVVIKNWKKQKNQAHIWAYSSFISLTIVINELHMMTMNKLMLLKKTHQNKSCRGSLFLHEIKPFYEKDHYSDLGKC